MDNQVGSINFDANALYLEEDDEHDYDDKQQDNEIKELISQGGLDAFLDDDSLISSSDESSSEESDSNSENNNRRQHHQPHPHHLIHHSTKIIHDKLADQSEQNSLSHEENAPMFSPMSNMNHNAAIPATPAIINLNTNNNNPIHLLDFRNKFSTPSNNQNPPQPQILQATAIPNVNMNLMNQQQQKTSDESMPKTQQPMYMMVDNDQTIATQQDDKDDDDDMNRAETFVQPTYDHNQFMNLQKQHFIPHSKLHSIERFAMPAAIIPQPAQPQSLITNDHELSLNETDNEDDTFKPANKIAAFGNGVQLEFNKATPKTSETNINHQQQATVMYEETSIIDLNELDEEQLKQLQLEEEKQQSEYFNIDHLNRLYCQAQFLYKIRGKKLEEVTNRFTAYQEDMSREIRAMKHRVYLAEKEKESAQASLEQVHELCGEYKVESEQAKKSASEMSERCEKLKHANFGLEQKLREKEEEIEALQAQIDEQQKMDTLERVQQQHEHFVEQLRQQFDKDMMVMRERLSEAQGELDQKSEIIRLMRLQLDTATKNAEMATIERSDTVNRLTKTINDLQAKYDQDVVRAGSFKSDERCRELEERLRMLEANNSGHDFYLPSLSQSTNDASTCLQKELERAMVALKQKKAEIQKLQSEIEKQKAESNNDPTPLINQLKTELDKLTRLIDELQREKLDLTHELMEKNSKLDELMGREDDWQQLRHNLEIEIYNKQQNLEQCEAIIDKLHSEKDAQQVINEYEAQIGELKLKLANREHEVQKVRDMYIEVCNDKNNLQDVMKVQFDEEYESRLRQRLEVVVGERLEEQREKWEKERAGLIEQMRLEKAKVEAEFKEKLKESLDKLREKEKEFFAVKLEYEKVKVEFDGEKKSLMLRLEKVGEEREAAKSKLNEVSADLEREKVKVSETLAELELEMVRVKECEAKLKLVEEEERRKMSQFEAKLEETEKSLAKVGMEKELEVKKLEALRVKHTSLAGKYEEAVEKLSREFEEKIRQAQNEAGKEMESARLGWAAEKSQLAAKKEEELQTYIEQLEKRFEEDYSKFMQTHKESMLKTLNEKSSEFNREKEKLIEMYEKRMGECEASEKAFAKQIKELKEKEKLNSFTRNKSTFDLNKTDAKVQTDESGDNELLEKIRSLETVISNTDAHFEQEIEKLRGEFEEEYRAKMREEFERGECARRELETEISNLRLQLRSSNSSSFSSDSSSVMMADNENCTGDVSFHHAKVKLGRREADSLEQTYRLRIEQMQTRFEEHLRQIQSKYESDVSRIRSELGDNYKQALAKSKADVEQMQAFVQKLKKTNSDSDKVIESLKLEMNKMKESHLDELTGMKMGAEREKEALKERWEQAAQRTVVLERQLVEAEERGKKQLDALKAELKLEYGTELSRMNAKMKDMMRSHGSAIEMLKKQHQNAKMNNYNHSNKSCQTETSSKDIELLETFRQKYLETLSKMKSDMMKEFDAQTIRVSERAIRQLNDERQLIHDKLHALLMPKIADMLRDFQISETLIEFKMLDLEKEISQITKSRKSNSSSSKTSQTQDPPKSQQSNYQSAKRSASALTSTRPSPPRKQSDEHHLYSKSVSSMPELQKTAKKADSLDDILAESTKKTPVNTNKLTTGYKYTPLRQSWSNLSQMNQLSPYSTYSRTPFENEVLEESAEHNISLTTSAKKKAVVNNSGSSEDLSYSNRQVSSAKDEVAKSCEYLDDTDEDVKSAEIDPSKSNLFKKFRTQNMRQKKKSSNTAIMANSVSSSVSSSLISKNPSETRRERSKSVVRSSAEFDEEDDEAPIKLDSERRRTTNTRSTSSIGAKISSNSTTAFTSNSLPRSVTPTNDLTAHSYRSATVSSINKSIENSASSTQYYPINASITAANNLLKTQAFQKKKSFFY